MDQAIRELLDASDNPIHEEEPPDLDWEALGARLERLEPKLSRIAGRKFDLDDTAEDATFFGDLGTWRMVRVPSGGTLMEAVFVARFSNFGSLFTTWSECRKERLSNEVIAELVRAVSFAGFHHVPTEALYTAYTGRNPAFEGATWWQRFFDYT